MQCVWFESFALRFAHRILQQTDLSSEHAAGPEDMPSKEAMELRMIDGLICTFDMHVQS